MHLPRVSCGCSWILGGVERTEERRVFLQRVETRDRRTLLGAIKKHVREGSIIYTDYWRAYAGLNERSGYVHWTVNHSKHFVDP